MMFTGHSSEIGSILLNSAAMTAWHGIVVPLCLKRIHVWTPGSARLQRVLNYYFLLFLFHSVKPLPISPLPTTFHPSFPPLDDRRVLQRTSGDGRRRFQVCSGDSRQVPTSSSWPALTSSSFQWAPSQLSIPLSNSGLYSTILEAIHVYIFWAFYRFSGF